MTTHTIIMSNNTPNTIQFPASAQSIRPSLEDEQNQETQPQQSDRVIQEVANITLQSEQTQTTQLPRPARPVAPATTSELIARIQPLIQQWQQNQNRQAVVQQMDTILTPLTSEQHSMITQSLAQTQDAMTAMHEIEQMRILQNGLNDVITRFKNNCLSELKEVESIASLTWWEALTPERVAELPASLQTSLRESAFYRMIVGPLFQLEIAYKNQDVPAMLTLRFDPNHGLAISVLAETRSRCGAKTQVTPGIDYYNSLWYRLHLQEMVGVDDHHAFSIKKCRDLLTVYNHPDNYRLRLEPSTLKQQLIDFLDMRVAFEERTVRMDQFAVCTALSDTDRRFLENQYSMPDENLTGFLIAYVRTKEIQQDCVHLGQQDLPASQRKDYQHDIYNHLSWFRLSAQDRHEGREGYDTLSDSVFQYAETSLRPFINDINRLVRDELNRDALSKQLAKFQRTQNPTVEQQNQHHTRCCHLIRNIETFSPPVSVATAFPIMQEALRAEDHRTTGSALIKYKIALEKLRTLSDDTQRIPIIWELAYIDAHMSSEDLAIVKTQLTTLYPSLLAPLNGITNTYELQYATLLIRVNTRRNRVTLDVDTILALQNIATHRSATECEALLRKFQTYLPDFTTRIPNVEELYPIIRTDMGALRETCRLSDPCTPLTLAAHTDIVNSIKRYHDSMGVRHYHLAIAYHLVGSGKKNPNAKNLLKDIYEADLELACTELTNQDAQVRNRSLVEIGETLASATAHAIIIRSDFLEYLRANYPAFRDQEMQAKYVQILYDWDSLADANEPNDRLILLMQEVAMHMSADACQTLRETLNLNQSFPDIPDTVHDQMKYLRCIQQLHDLPTTADQMETRTQCLHDIVSISLAGNMIEQQRHMLATTPEGRDLLRNSYAAKLEWQYRELKIITQNLQIADRPVQTSIEAIQNSALYILVRALHQIQELETTIRQMNILDYKILAPNTLATLTERYPSGIPHEEIECMTYILLLAKCETDRQHASPEELVLVNERRHEAFTHLSRIATTNASQFTTYIARTQRVLESGTDSDEQVPINSIRNVINSLSISEFGYNARYSLSTDHYNHVRLDDTIPALPSTVNADTTFREGLTAFFDEISFEELQAYLTDTNMTRDTARSALTTYIQNVLNRAPLFGAPNPTTHPEQARAWWDEITHTIVNVIVHIRHLQPGSQQSETEIQKKKKNLLATLIGSVGMCAGRYRADAALLYQQIVLGTPVSFVTEVNRQLNALRENNARNLSVRDAEDEGMQPHEYIGFLRLIGRELAIPGTELAARSDADIQFTQTRMYRRYGNNTPALRKRFEEKYTPFTIISCIAQEVGPRGSQQMRDFFWKWCYDHMPVSQYWGMTKERSDWGNYYEDICGIDLTRKRLREIRRCPSPDAIDTYLKGQKIQRKSTETPEQAVLRVSLIPYKSPEEIDVAVNACESDIQKRAYLDHHMYELPPSQWTQANRAEHLKVKLEFIAQMLGQMGVLRSTGSSLHSGQ